MDRQDFIAATAAYDHWIKVRGAWVALLLVAFGLAMFCHGFPAMIAFAVACAWWAAADLRARHWYAIWRRGARP